MSLGWLPDGRAALVGVVHVLPLPGSPRWNGDIGAVRDAARRDAEALAAGGCDAIIVENMHDRPYLKDGVPPETVAAMTLATADVVGFGVPVGVQVLAGANREALGVAVATGAAFVRVEGWAYGHVADEGWIEASAAEVTRVRAALRADVAIVADVQKKHAAHAATADLSLAELAHGAGFCDADAVVVTGSRTGASTSVDDVREAATAGLPVWVGSGVTPADAAALAREARALIVGSWLKEDGDWRNAVEKRRVVALRAAMGA
jgi:membrane complex biogenesis BtpA family protein